MHVCVYEGVHTEWKNKSTEDLTAPRYVWRRMFIVDMRENTARGIWKNPDWTRQWEVWESKTRREETEQREYLGTQKSWRKEIAYSKWLSCIWKSNWDKDSETQGLERLEVGVGWGMCWEVLRGARPCNKCWWCWEGLVSICFDVLNKHLS